MNNSLIINVRGQMHWQQRLFSDASTAMLWGCWLWLFRPAFYVIAGIFAAALGLQHAWVAPSSLSGPASLESAVLGLMATALLLPVWNSLTTKPRWGKPTSPSGDSTAQDCAAHCGLTAGQLQHYRSSKIAVVHHDELGHIVSIEMVDMESPMAAPGQRLAA